MVMGQYMICSTRGKSINNNQQRKKLRAVNLCMSLRAIFAQIGSATFFPLWLALKQRGE